MPRRKIQETVLLTPGKQEIYTRELSNSRDTCQADQKCQDGN